jgi:hypothetical protein
VIAIFSGESLWRWGKFVEDTALAAVVVSSEGNDKEKVDDPCLSSGRTENIRRGRYPRRQRGRLGRKGGGEGGGKGGYPGRKTERDQVLGISRSMASPFHLILVVILMTTLPVECHPGPTSVRPAHAELRGNVKQVWRDPANTAAIRLRGGRPRKREGGERKRRVSHARELIGADGKREMVSERNKTNELFETYYRLGPDQRHHANFVAHRLEISRA